ncbi:MAG: hypothetical protein AAF828_06700, partial [Bacteroidota bacterium]
PPPPDESKKSADQLSNDPDMLKKLRSKMSSRRYKLQKRLLELAELPDNHPKRARLAAKRKEFRECDQSLEEVKLAIKSLKNDAEKTA